MREYEKQKYIRRQNQRTCVTRIERSRHKGGRGLFLLTSPAWHVESISYRRVGCVDEMIVFTVCYHSNPRVHILTAFLSSRSQATAILQSPSW